MTSPQPWGIYVHVPWCRIRCPYCAFHVDRDHAAVPWTRFVDRVLEDHAAASPHFEGAPATLYLGGGTPSRMPPASLARLVTQLTTDATAEITLEANPEDIDAAWLDATQQAGVRRLSLGVQTLDPALARRLGRAHTPADARRALDLVARADLQSWSVDLMFGLPGQDADQLATDLDAMLAWAPPHVSVYGLTIEPGTAYARAEQRGSLVPVADETWRHMLDLLLDRLEAAGLHRYEISNFARPGHQSRHNRGYWLDQPYMGLGPSAHGLRPDGARTEVVSDTAAWLDGPDGSLSVEHPSPLECATERLVSGLRGLDGLSLDALAAHTGHAPAARAVRQLRAAGLLEDHAGGTRLTRDGLYVADGVTRALVRALEPVDDPRLDQSSPSG